MTCYVNILDNSSYFLLYLKSTKESSKWTVYNWVIHDLGIRWIIFMKGTTSLTSYWKDFTVQKRGFLHDVAVFVGETIFFSVFSRSFQLPLIFLPSRASCLSMKAERNDNSCAQRTTAREEGGWARDHKACKVMKASVSLMTYPTVSRCCRCWWRELKNHRHHDAIHFHLIRPLRVISSCWVGFGAGK